jgi:hypothetical protein
VLARYTTHDHWAGHAPLDIEFAFWSAASGQVVHATLRQVPPFEVSAYGAFLTGTAILVDGADGGLLFQPPSRSASYFIHSDGRVEAMELPPNAAITDAVRAGKRWLLTEARGADADIWWRDDGDSSWTERSWTLGEVTKQRGWYEAMESTAFDTSLSLLNGKAILSVSPERKAMAFPLDGAVSEDPPNPIPFDSSSLDSACGAGMSTRSDRVDIPKGREIHLRVEGGAKAGVLGQLKTWSRVTHETPEGKTCTSAYLLSGGNAKGQGQDAMLYREGKVWAGWWFARQMDGEGHTGNSFDAVRLTCSP